MNVCNKELQPSKTCAWRRDKGSLKSIKELKHDSKIWSLDTWNKYLKSLEKRHREESLHKAQFTESVLDEDYSDMVFSFSNGNKFTHLASSLNALMRELSPRECKVLKMIYWEQLSQRKVAQNLKISRRHLRIILHRGLKKLEKLKKNKKNFLQSKKVRKKHNVTKTICASVKKNILNFVAHFSMFLLPVFCFSRGVKNNFQKK